MYLQTQYLHTTVLLILTSILLLAASNPVAQSSPPNNTTYNLICADEESGDPLCKDAKCTGSSITGGPRACQSLCYCKSNRTPDPIGPHPGPIIEIPKPICPPGPFLHPPHCTHATCVNGAIAGKSDRACTDLCSCNPQDVGFTEVLSTPRCPKGPHIWCGDATCMGTEIVGAMRQECLDECTCDPPGPPKLDCGHAVLEGRNGTRQAGVRMGVLRWCERKAVSAVCGARGNVVVQGRDVLGVCGRRCRCS